MLREFRESLLAVDGLTSPLPGVTVGVCRKKAAPYT